MNNALTALQSTGHPLTQELTLERVTAMKDRFQWDVSLVIANPWVFLDDVQQFFGFPEGYDGFDDSMDGDHESALASVGWGTDEDYGTFDGGDE